MIDGDGDGAGDRQVVGVGDGDEECIGSGGGDGGGFVLAGVGVVFGVEGWGGNARRDGGGGPVVGERTAPAGSEASAVRVMVLPEGARVAAAALTSSGPVGTAEFSKVMLAKLASATAPLELAVATKPTWAEPETLMVWGEPTWVKVELSVLKKPV